MGYIADADLRGDTTVIRTNRAIGTLVLATSFALGAAGCSSEGAGQSTGASAQVGPQVAPQVGLQVAPQAFADFASKAGVVVLDVRTPAEFTSGHLPGAVNLDIQGADFPAGLAKLDPSASYAVYCHSGNRSGVALQQMAANGFARTIGLAGGIAAWTQASGPVVTG